MFGKRGGNIGSIDDAPQIQVEPVSAETSPVVEPSVETVPVQKEPPEVAVAPPMQFEGPQKSDTDAAEKSEDYYDTKTSVFQR